MADIGGEYNKGVDEITEPVENEVKILAENCPKKEAVDTKEAEASAAPKEQKLPKLSLAEFRVYNSMAEHMEYFVC